MELEQEWASSRARQVVELIVRRGGPEAVLVVRTVGRGGPTTRELRAPEATVTHAARAIARHYGLSPTELDRWRRTADPAVASAA
ncbi:MAG: hypothetical protein ACK4V6_03675 [Microthrixaceae bacterium]